MFGERQVSIWAYAAAQVVRRALLLIKTHEVRHA
jgi:hypothetical protein